MTLVPDSIQRQLCEQLCASVRVERRFDGELMLETDFGFPDGDNYPIYLSDKHDTVRLSDKGDTLMRMGYEREIDRFLTKSRLLLIDQILGEERVCQNEGEFFVDSRVDGLSDALFRYGRAITRIYNLTLHKHSRPIDTFYCDLNNLIFQKVNEEQVQRQYRVPQIQNSDIYPVDYRFKGKEADHLFMYGIPNKDKAHITTITLYYFLMNKVSFDSILVFRNQSEIPKTSLTRLSSVGGKMVSSLDYGTDMFLEMDRRIASA